MLIGIIGIDHWQYNGRLERKLSEQNMGAPPSYEEAVGESRSPVNGERYEFYTAEISTIDKICV